MTMLWQRPARSLPVRVRPVGGESVVSFTFRLSAANHLVHPTSVLRALGESRPRLPTRADLAGQDVVLNDRALDRLETLAGIPAARLRRALPALDRGATAALPTGHLPAFRLYRCPSLRGPCDTCRSRVAGPGPVMVHPRPHVAVCSRHRRWIDTGPGQRVQLDLSGAPEILGADRRYARLCRSRTHPEWVGEQLRLATRVACTWATGSHRTSPRLHARWAARAAALRTDDGARDGALGPGRPSRVLVFPEAVAIASLFCDRPWRRHVAMVESELHLRWFYQRVAVRLGEPPAVGDAIRSDGSGDPGRDPLLIWITANRTFDAAIRTRLWHDVRHGAPPFGPAPHGLPFPALERF